ncbi:hypothetical protein Taro_012771 [Colocasia esculenta]|uniref:Uncharacterized protein n=1 Tax=Colocasia esculenta TaxID=4460 RepID=A0A843UDN9_COLES|nr:hypothetical protein [Colocasia esculenta]
MSNFWVPDLILSWKEGSDRPRDRLGPFRSRSGQFQPGIGWIGHGRSDLESVDPNPDWLIPSSMDPVIHG